MRLQHRADGLVMLAAAQRVPRGRLARPKLLPQLLPDRLEAHVVPTQLAVDRQLLLGAELANLARTAHAEVFDALRSFCYVRRSTLRGMSCIRTPQARMARKVAKV